MAVHYSVQEHIIVRGEGGHAGPIDFRPELSAAQTCGVRCSLMLQDHVKGLTCSWQPDCCRFIDRPLCARSNNSDYSPAANRLSFNEHVMFFVISLKS